MSSSEGLQMLFSLKTNATLSYYYFQPDIDKASCHNSYWSKSVYNGKRATQGRGVILIGNDEIGVRVEWNRKW